MDLLGDIFGGAPPAMGMGAPPAAKPGALFGDLDGLGGLSGSSFPVAAAAAPSPITPSQQMMAGTGTSPMMMPSKPLVPSSSPAMTSTSISSPAMGGSSSSTVSGGPYNVFEKDGFRITMSTSRNELGDAVTLNTTFNNGSSKTLSGLNFQAAVPKALKLQMMPASSTSIAPGATASQVIRISNPSKVKKPSGASEAAMIGFQGVETYSSIASSSFFLYRPRSSFD